MTCLVVGPSGSGKTYLIKRLKHCCENGFTNCQGLTFATIPTIGTNLINVKLSTKRSEVTLTEVGGKMGPIWKNYYQGTTALMFVIDLANRQQVSASCVQLMDVLAAEPLNGCNVLVVLNKCDQPMTMSRLELENMIRLDEIVSNCRQKVSVLEVSAVSGTGLQQVAQWLDINTHDHIT